MVKDTGKIDVKIEKLRKRRTCYADGATSNSSVHHSESFSVLLFLQRELIMQQKITEWKREWEREKESAWGWELVQARDSYIYLPTRSFLLYFSNNIIKKNYIYDYFKQ